MRFLLFLFIVYSFSASVFANNAQVDSLKNVLIHAKTQQIRMKACLNLDNYYRNILRIDSLPLTRALLSEGVKANNEYIIADALRKIVMSVDRKKRVLTHDSIIHYLELADQYLTGDRRKSFITEVRLKHIRSISDWTKDENDVIESLTKQYTNSEERSNDIYFQIERNYALGMAAALTISETGKETYKNASRYFDRVFELIQKLPVEYGGDLLFWVNENIYLSYENAENRVKAVAFLEKMMEILEQYKELPEVKEDVYQTFEYVYSLYYLGMAHYPSLVGYNKALACLKKSDEMLRKRGELSVLYFAYKGFYEDLGDYKMTILYQDSVIHYMKNYDSAVAQAVSSSMYKEQAKCYAALHDYKSAYERMGDYDVLREKIVNDKSKALRTEMDVRYDLNHLELEKEKLTSRNRQIAFISACFVVFLSVAWGISQRFHLNRLKRIQKKLVESNKEVLKQSEKAQESEKMKTAFVNSMCHEIRTPLNAINGFSELLLDDSIDNEYKEGFPELIWQNTNLLTRLLNDLLEVSRLSTSLEELPMEEADISVVCEQEMDKLKSLEKKNNIEYSLEFRGNCCIRTNTPYLSQAIAHLLSNANKFTESGQIRLQCFRDVERKLVITVTDTGVGIPADKQEWVFERFAKLDDFKQGAGLGLYICRLIVERLGGTIHIDGKYTEGTCFVLTFPFVSIHGGNINIH